MNAARTTTLRCWLFGALALACAVGAGLLLPGLNRQRERLELSGFADLGEAPPQIVLLATGLGPFRAIAIDILWIRAMKLQEEGKFFELNDLFRLISQLQPRFPMVWAHWAWNLAYNVSVKFPAMPGDERWRWVSLGIAILRDQGIRYNPRSFLLYRELSWIYNHKIGGDSDDANVYYKVALAAEVQDAFGTPPYTERVRAMAAAPTTREALLEDPAVKTLVDRLAAAGFEPFDHPLQCANRGPDLPGAAAAILADPANAQAVAGLDVFLRARYVQDRLKLDPAKLREYMDRFGPIDWRLPAAQTLYWAARSVQVLGGDIDKAANADRIFLYAVENLYRHGNLRFLPATEHYDAVWAPAPNFAFIPAVVRLQESIAERYKGTYDEKPTLDGYMNFLREVILDLYVYGNQKAAGRHLKMLQDLGGEPKETALDEFVWRRYREILAGFTYDHAKKLVTGHYFQSLWLASFGDDEGAASQETFANWLWEKYNGHLRRLKLPPKRDLLKDAIRQAMLSFRDWQFEAVRRRFPDVVKELQKELEQERQAPAAGPPPPPKKEPEPAPESK